VSLPVIFFSLRSGGRRANSSMPARSISALSAVRDPWPSR
jgi:hypothetical protein